MDTADSGMRMTLFGSRECRGVRKELSVGGCHHEWDLAEAGRKLDTVRKRDDVEFGRMKQMGASNPLAASWEKGIGSMRLMEGMCEQISEEESGR